MGSSHVSARAAFIKHYFGKEWPNRHLYHLMINTAMGDELAANTILECMKSVASKKEKVEVMR